MPKVSYMNKSKAKSKPVPPQVSAPLEIYPFPNGTILAGEVKPHLGWPMPYALEVVAWEEVYVLNATISGLTSKLSDQAETLERLRRLLGGRLPTDGTYDVSFIAGGDLVQQINEGLQAVASDIHRRAGIDEARKIAISIKAEPSENSAAVKWGYEVKVSLAKAEGGGVAYIDKDGRLCPPENVTADQIMLPLDQAGKPAKAA
jgi:hypothetical protein